MKLIVGLGNPGSQYSHTWHNLGFKTLDCLQNRLAAGPFKMANKFQAQIATSRIGQEKIILAKPQTFMNNSGQAIAAIANYYKIPISDIIVIHDDLDLPLGAIRVAQNSSAGGHNGVKSVINHLSSQKFSRIKIGVQTTKTKQIAANNYVLKKIGFWDGKKAKAAVEIAAAAAQELVSQPIEKVMNLYN
ncbi:MAG TPA: aminoacyl-tRNA hydrolase [bacterium]|nr:aminoacyl-tRNA hydrolase [bacterium]HOH67179.1 aminoacyl-tRNA hydrolase [bacterium]HQA64121.1 aminoacyl-tRNA hydrolase [bacterium]